MLVVSLLLISGLVQAGKQEIVTSGDGGGKMVTFKGSLSGAVMCTINNGDDVNVSFGNVNITNIRDGRYIRPVPYLIRCQGASIHSMVYMRLDTDRRGVWDTNAMGTTLDGLEVKFLNNGTPQKVGEWFRVDLFKQPSLNLQLEINPNITPELMPFTATGTLTAEFF
ncbi:fimbrial protein [Enterobacter bugandensis]|uniref:fimbrial protein n=1 Tax=Enterobacter bugandensis TaxID=881260 RepID=UPI0006683FD5|nr:fimbrial protein [Enterobacter bugandensis]